MKRQMTFKQVFYDVQPIGDKTTVSFFTETNKNDETVTLMSEDQAIKWLFQNKPFRQLFIGGFFGDTKNIKTYFGLTEPFTTKNKKPGDIDLLFVDPDQPDKSVAFECKRVKALSIDNQTSKINNAEKIKHGVIQANKYQSLGFHQSYLVIILLDDGRHYNSPNILFRNTSTEQLKRVYDIPWNEPLHNDVGIIFITINQPTGNHINLTGGLGFCIDKLAQPLEQTVSMTNKIIDLIKYN
jgi:hypothetical protein